MTSTKIYVDLYKANWCGACTRYYPIWLNLEKAINSDKIKKMLKDENIEIDMKCYEETKDSKLFEEQGITSYPTIKISKIDKSGKKSELSYSSREPEVFIKEAFEVCSDKLKKAILDEYKSFVSKMSGGYFDYVNKPQFKYYGAYLRYRQKYLALKNK